MKAESLKYLLIFSLAIFVFNFFWGNKIRADNASFYTTRCFGSFNNPEKAQGQPEVNDPNLINESNSAVYYTGFKEIYCGNFQGPIEEGEIQKISLHFN